jgi:ATP-dependent helicase YprA (DUF1998 family)
VTQSNNNISEVIHKWESGILGGEIPVRTVVSAIDAKVKEYPEWLDDRVIAALARAGVKKPYTHQVESWNKLHLKNNILVATPTASGKTLCYNPRLLMQFVKDRRQGRSIFFLPRLWPGIRSHQCVNC